jgi:predicted Zn-dependent peptidase
LQEIAKNFSLYGELTFHKYCDLIDAVTVQDVAKFVEKVVGGKPTLVVTGDAINMVPNITDVSRQLN